MEDASKEILEIMQKAKRNREAEQGSEGHSGTKQKQTKRKAQAPEAAAVAEKPQPKYRLEKTRSQFVCRTGMKGPGSAAIFKFGKEHGTQESAEKKAQQRVKDHS